MLSVLWSDIDQLVFLAVLLLLSGVFSGSETALFSLDATDLNRLRREESSVNRSVLALHADLGDLLMTVLFCNMVVNILFFASSTTVATDLSRYVGREYGQQYAPLAGLGVGMAFLMLVITFGEVAPKSLASVAKLPFCRMAALPLLALHRLLAPLRYVLGKVIRGSERVVGISTAPSVIEPEELRLLVEMSRADGIISTDEHDLIGEVLELPEIRAREMMTPRVDMVTVDSGASVDDLLALARSSGHAKLPVRDAVRDEVVGWVDARDVFADPEPGPLSAYIRKPFFVSELDRADQILERLRSRGVRLAVVVDERGGTEGILTLADVLAEIFGEFGDEDHDNEPVREDGENTYVLSAELSVREWRTLFGVALDLPSTTTVGGLVVALLGRPARRGDTVDLRNLRMEVLSVARRRVRAIRLTLLPAEGAA